MTAIHPSVIMSDAVVLAADVQIGPGVVFAGSCTLNENVKIGAGAVIADSVEIGWGAEVLPGTVVLASVPANAIAQGNPAQIVGYQAGHLDGHPADVHRSAVSSTPTTKRTKVKKVSLGVGESALYLMPNVPDLRGNLTVGEIERDLPFMPKRYFAVYNVPTEKLRGEHAHHACEQFLICLNGSCMALLDDGHTRKEVVLDSPDMGLYMPAMIWGTQYRYTRDAVLLVFASHPYDPSDYIRTYDAFQVARAASDA